MVYVCKLCRGAVVPNYDHVGDCESPGQCHGTFWHPRLKPPQACSLVSRELAHVDVLALPT